MSTPPNPAARITDSDYTSIKAFIQRCWTKYPEFVKHDLQKPPLSIEIDEDYSAPVGSICWFVKRQCRNLIAVPMNQSPAAFEKEFVRTFNTFKLWS